MRTEEEIKEMIKMLPSTCYTVEQLGAYNRRKALEWVLEESEKNDEK